MAPVVNVTRSAEKKCGLLSRPVPMHRRRLSGEKECARTPVESSPLLTRGQKTDCSSEEETKTADTSSLRRPEGNVGGDAERPWEDSYLRNAS